MKCKNKCLLGFCASDEHNSLNFLFCVKQHTHTISTHICSPTPCHQSKWVLFKIDLEVRDNETTLDIRTQTGYFVSEERGP